jgi:hypothetical protein
MNTPPAYAEDTASPSRPTARSVRAFDFLDIDLNVLQGFIPAAVFLIAHQIWPTRIAIALSFTATVIVFARNKHSGVIRFLSALGFAIAALSTAIGLAFDSGLAFVAQNIFSDVVFTFVFAGSVLAGRPLIGGIARELVPAIRPVLHVNTPVFVYLSLLNAGINAFSAGIRYVMIESFSIDLYVILSRVVFLPLNIAFIVLCYVWITRTAIRLWPDDMPYEHLRRRGRRLDASL